MKRKFQYIIDEKVVAIIANEPIEKLLEKMHDEADTFDASGKHALSERPRMPPGRIIQEGAMGSCHKCGSTEKRKFIFFGKVLGCIQPECSNYWRTNVVEFLKR